MAKDKIIITDEKVEVNGKIYLPEETINKSPNYIGIIKIVVLQRGWIFIGRYSEKDGIGYLQNAYCIREWGTTKGLPELVNGPTTKTILDKCEGIVTFNLLTICFTIDTKEESWKLI